MYSRKHGTESAESPKLMISRALAHHRAAMDGLGGGFCVMRRIASRDDWIVVEANRRVRDAFAPVFGDPVGRLLSELNRHADNSSALDLYATVLATGERAEREIEIQIPGEPSGWRRLVAVPIAPETVAALTWDITASGRRAARWPTRSSTAPRSWSRRPTRSSPSATTVASPAATAPPRLTFGSGPRATPSAAATATSSRPRPTRPCAPRSPRAPTTRVETNLLRADGSEFVAQVAISEVETSQGTVFTAIVRDVTEQRAAEAALRVALECDDLTGRPNLHSLLLRTDEAARRAETAGHSIGVLFVDLDRFTLVNDSLGHDLGDALLVDVADRVAAVVREDDVVARISGDHFLVLCDRVDDDNVLVELASRIHDALRTPFALGAGHEVFVTVSIGAARWHGREAPRDLVRFAHTAMQQAKQTGPSSVRVFSGEMAVVSASRLETETALRRALDRDELQAYYQPIVDLETGATVRMEALVRWSRPGDGLVQPDEFIDLAEQTGLIVPLGAWMLRRALTDCAAWQPDAPGVGVAVNVSAHQFRTGDLVAMVQSLLTELDLAARPRDAGDHRVADARAHGVEPRGARGAPGARRAPRTRRLRHRVQRAHPPPAAPDRHDQDGPLVPRRHRRGRRRGDGAGHRRARPRPRHGGGRRGHRDRRRRATSCTRPAATAARATSSVAPNASTPRCCRFVPRPRRAPSSSRR